MDDIVRWKVKKLIKQFDREASWRYKLSSGLQMHRSPFDTVPQSIGLEGFEPDAEFSESFMNWWPRFNEECVVRSEKYESDCRLSNIPMVQRYFHIATVADFDLDTD